MPEQKLRERPGSFARRRARRLADQGRPGFFVTPRHNVLHLPRRPTAVAIVGLIGVHLFERHIALTGIERVREILSLKA